VNSPRAVADSVKQLCGSLRLIREEPQRRAESVAARAQAREEERRQRELLLEVDWLAPRTPRDEEPAAPMSQVAVVPRRPPLTPVRLILVDEADRLKVASLEQLRDLFDCNGIGLILIGMPGIEKRLARYPQLSSRVGFVHAFRTLRPEEIRQLLAEHGPEVGLMLPASGISDQEAIAAIIHITGGNFRLLRRLLSQVDRILGINKLQVVTPGVVEAARESLVIGTA